jgi:hypothetical protein
VRGFARSPIWCHVAIATDDLGANTVLVGELDDNPGTTAGNAIEEVAVCITRDLLGGDPDFVFYEYVPVGLPSLKPTFYRVEWTGQPGHFSMPDWHIVEPDSDAGLRELRDLVIESGYTSKVLMAERKLEVIDSRDREDLPTAS